MERYAKNAGAVFSLKLHKYAEIGEEEGPMEFSVP